ncbi:MAG: nitroreductase family deazaflavin-dependent oxidoreductase [Chloroflexota bacterium]
MCVSPFNDDLIADFRANGKVTTGPFVGRDVLLLTTTGAMTGAPRTAPLVYSRDGDRYVIVASKGGAPTHPAWFLNLRAHPNVTVEIPGARFSAHARIVNEPERRRIYDAHAALNPSFLEYEKKTTRRIPVVVLERLP